MNVYLLSFKMDKYCSNCNGEYEEYDCSSCEEYRCSNCMKNCLECKLYNICHQCFVKYHQEACKKCEEFGVIGKECGCKRHFGWCGICSNYKDTITINVKCINYELDRHNICHNDIKLSFCKQHFDKNNLTKEDLNKYKEYSFGCDFCGESYCYTCNRYKFNNSLTIVQNKSFYTCGSCGSISEILKQKFTDIEYKILLEYLFNV